MTRDELNALKSGMADMLDRHAHPATKAELDRIFSEEEALIAAAEKSAAEKAEADGQQEDTP